MSKRSLWVILFLIFFTFFSIFLKSPDKKLQGKALAFFDSILPPQPDDEGILVVENCLYPTEIINEERRKKELPQIEGLIYFPKKGETLENIAKKYNLSPKEILKANNLKDPSEISDLDFLILPGVKEKKENKISNVSHFKNIVKKINSANGYPYGYCTFYVATKRNDLPSRLGNARDWLKNARALGLSVCEGNICQPKKGAVISLKGSHALGHVALVEKVEGDTILISEMNFKKWGEISQRKIKIGDSSIEGYIY